VRMTHLAFVVVFLGVLVSNVSCTAGQGTFTVNCSPLTIQRSDPIVNPGVPGAHVHSVVGGNAFQRVMGPMDALKANSTTCDKGIDLSNYWVPQLYHQRPDKMWEIVPFYHNAVYYQLRACDYAPGLRKCDNPSPEGTKIPMAFPDGFRMVAGDPFRRTQNNSDPAQRAVHMVCLKKANSGDSLKEVADGPGFPAEMCDKFRAEVYFPSCWDGVNLDTPDHKSHMAYPAIGDYNGGVCPQSHPVALFSIFFEFFFDTSKITDPMNKNYAFANGDPTAFGYHGDFVMGWKNRTLLQTAHMDCRGPSDCPTLINQGPSLRPLIYPAPVEDVGLHGFLPSLPGNNPVVWPTNPINDY